MAAMSWLAPSYAFADTHVQRSIILECDVLPPCAGPHQTSAPGGYIPDDVVEGYLDTYEDVLLGSVWRECFLSVRRRACQPER